MQMCWWEVCGINLTYKENELMMTCHAVQEICSSIVCSGCLAGRENPDDEADDGCLYHWLSVRSLGWELLVRVAGLS